MEPYQKPARRLVARKTTQFLAVPGRIFQNGQMQKELLLNALQALHTQAPQANVFQTLAVSFEEAF